MYDLNLSFDGSASDAFIREMQRIGYSERLLSEDQRMAELASTFLVGSAMVWWVGLEPAVQGSWRLLRTAILNKYPPRPCVSPSYDVFLSILVHIERTNWITQAQLAISDRLPFTLCLGHKAVSSGSFAATLVKMDIYPKTALAIFRPLSGCRSPRPFPEESESRFVILVHS